MHCLIMGHTGFKGSCLAWLPSAEGHRVSEISLDTGDGSRYGSARVHGVLADGTKLDSRNDVATAAVLQRIAPEMVTHMAAQPFVWESYRDPRTTFKTNVLGTLNVLEPVAWTPSVTAHVVVTNDKVYQNVNQEAGDREEEALGVGDPYCSSNAMSNVLVQSWIASFDNLPTAIARAQRDRRWRRQHRSADSRPLPVILKCRHSRIPLPRRRSTVATCPRLSRRLCHPRPGAFRRSRCWRVELRAGSRELCECGRGGQSCARAVG